jgi:hypothetical protein
MQRPDTADPGRGHSTGNSRDTSADSPVLATCAQVLAALPPWPHGATPYPALTALIDADVGKMPLPGPGATWQRWQVLASVGAHDLALAKLLEGHTDALAIMAELQAPVPSARSSWGTWAAEPPNARVVAHLAPRHRRCAAGSRHAGGLQGLVLGC